MVELVPSILSADFARLADEIAAAERGGGTVIHVDVMDGHFVPNITDPELISLIRRFDVTLVSGETDAFLENNLTFNGALWEKGLRPQFHVWEGEAHRARYWREMVVHYL